MHYIQLNDELFQEAQRRALAAGFTTVDEYFADVLQHDSDEEDDDLNHLFTPERLARIYQAAAQIEAGLGMSYEQVDIEIDKRRAEWLKNRNQG